MSLYCHFSVSKLSDFIESWVYHHLAQSYYIFDTLQGCCCYRTHLFGPLLENVLKGNRIVHQLMVALLNRSQGCYQPFGKGCFEVTISFPGKLCIHFLL